MKHASWAQMEASYGQRSRLDPWPLDADGWPYIPQHTSDWVEFTEATTIAPAGVQYMGAGSWVRMTHPPANPTPWLDTTP
jgi:hypothetical protein